MGMAKTRINHDMLEGVAHKVRLDLVVSGSNDSEIFSISVQQIVLPELEMAINSAIQSVHDEARGILTLENKIQFVESKAR